MASTDRVYLIHDAEPSVIPHTGLSPQDAYGAHVFRWKEYLFIASNKKPNVSGVRDISLKGLGNEQGFLHCDRCDAVMIEYLKIVKTEWLKFAEAFESGLQCLLQTTKEAEVEKALKQLKNFLHILRDNMGNITREQQTENIQHPKSWALDSLLCLLGDFLGRMEMIEWAFNMAKQSKGPYELLSLRDDLMYLTGKETCFALSPSVRLPSCAELEAGVSANGFHKTELHMFKEDSGKLLGMDVRSLLNPPDEGERKAIAASTELRKISQPPSITQSQVNFPHRVRFLQLMGHTSG
ncbi:uncharacterized protein BDCG_00009 [Blastomyces dermatitidis ER-3]|uniref:Uncharacterized protein n=2 Tax=Ajellomyces dermatitidis TaxID=5039 RepID=A0ABP2EJS3_AJEDR|nr:uncharacterized protein BDCG_00009 [Blastomyces dermatitidis ER-3]EEQ83204.2 hypothetical protein BDCG_00009 [Blastomyces dermatitidis ER-3]